MGGGSAHGATSQLTSAVLRVPPEESEPGFPNGTTVPIR